eukprot:SAG31_NODE_12511_length_936_cov_1.186380_1_plen_86_part_00
MAFARANTLIFSVYPGSLGGPMSRIEFCLVVQTDTKFSTGREPSGFYSTTVSVFAYDMHGQRRHTAAVHAVASSILNLQLLVYRQ